MRVLYAIQGTGNGHVSRANEIIPYLKERCDLDILLSGTQCDVGLNVPATYRNKGLSFIFGKKGGVDFKKTLGQLQSKKFLHEIKNLPVEKYDLVINDFEPVSAWACRVKNVPSVAMSHQWAVLQKNAPRPSKFDPFALMVLKYYAPCKTGEGFHFKKYGTHIHTPVIRSEIRNADVGNKGHFTIYLPAYEDEKIISFFSKFRQIDWQIFSKHTNKSYKEKNCYIRPVNAKAFTESFINCEGIVCGAGFETPAEALYLGKKLLVIPMKHQYEQHCNAAAVEELGVPVIKSLKKKHISKAENWLMENKTITLDFENETESIIDSILASFKTSVPAAETERSILPLTPEQYLALR